MAQGGDLRAAVSIPANLAEGVGRGTRTEAARFAHVALGSLYELDTELCIAAELGYLSQEAACTIRDRLSTLSRRLSSYTTDKSPQT